MSATNGIVNLQDLPSDKICIRLPSDIQRDMVRTALKFSKNRYRLAKEIDVKEANLRDLELSRFKSITLSIIIKLSKFLVNQGYSEYSLEKLEGKIDLIKAKFVGIPIIKPKFPIDFNCKKGFQIVSAILFDGGITANFIPIYVNLEEKLIDKFVANIKKVIGDFEITGNVKKKNNSENVYRITLPKVIGYILSYGLKVPIGNKTMRDPSIPRFVVNGNKKFQKAFLQQAFDDEGTVVLGIKDGSGRAVRFSQSNSEKIPPVRLTQLKRMLIRLNVIALGPYFVSMYIDKEGNKSFSYSIQLSNFDSIKCFAKNVNFSLKRQRIKLKKVLNSYKSIFYES